jgi:ABC-type anion transport system duplicated permease subunit
VHKFLRDHIDPGVFAPDAVGTLIAAFDGAWQSIIAGGARLSAQQRELTRELLAKYIIAQARQGELDQRRLRDGALLHLARSNLRRPPREQK